MTERSKERETAAAAPEDTKDTWYLEDVYPETDNLFNATVGCIASDKSLLVVLDTNVLLLPYNVGGQELPKITDVYKKLSAEKRLFIPTRVVREFIKNRDDKLGEMLEKLNNSSSQLAVPSVQLPSLLEGVEKATAVTAAAKNLATAKTDYLKSIATLREMISGWRDNDPVTLAYNDLFTKDLQIDHELSREEVENRWKVRRDRQIPPGYKDKAKPDGGIGDYLIWLSILRLGEQKKQDLIFVTGEEKSDWLVRGVYPRQELIDEYRRASGGKTLRLIKLADLLSDLDAPSEVVDEVRQAEKEANTEHRLQSDQAVWPEELLSSWGAFSKKRSNWHSAFVQDYNLKSIANARRLSASSFGPSGAGRLKIAEDDVTIDLRFVVVNEEEVVFRSSDPSHSVAAIRDVQRSAPIQFPPLIDELANSVDIRENLDLLVVRPAPTAPTLTVRIIELDHENRTISVAYNITRRRLTLAP